MNENISKNIASNIGKVVDEQKDLLKETITPEEVQQKLAKPVVYVDKDKKESQGNSKKKMVFQGFQYSEETEAKSEIFLPLLNVKIRQTPIIFKEELAIAQTIIQEKDVSLDIIQTIFRHIIEGPEDMIKDFESFLARLHNQDLQSLIYGFYLTSYGPIHKLNETLICKECGGEHTIKEINLIDIYKEEAFPGKPFESLDYEETLDLSDCGIKDVIFYLKFPLMSNYDFGKNISKENYIKEVASTSLSAYVSRFSNKGIIYDDKESIENAVNTLNVKGRRALKKKLDETILKYGVKLEYTWVCKNQVKDEKALQENATKICGTENIRRYIMNDLFFREISESVS